MSTIPTLSAPAVDRQILHVAVAQRLRTMIMEGDLAPGTRLNERVLCDLLQVSRTPLREAFKVLAADGLVTLLPNRGALRSRAMSSASLASASSRGTTTPSGMIW